MIRSAVRGFALASGISLAACGGSGSPPAQGSLPAAASARAATADAQIGPRLAAVGPHASTVTVIIMENRDYDLVIGSSDAPYINNTLVPEAALLTDSHAVTHPSQPNYLALFSGSTQGITDDSCPHTFSANNLGAEVLSAKNETFDGYSESMPSNGYTGCSTNLYARKHNPWSDFSNVPATSNLVYNGFPDPPQSLTFIVPNLCNDMHDCSTQTGDTWLSNNVPAILSYDNAHNGLLIITWDEADPDANGQNQIATLLLGPMIKPGQYNQNVNHYSILRTIEKILKVKCINSANDCKAAVLTKMWQK
jgi:hypothetical protein